MNEPLQAAGLARKPRHLAGSMQPSHRQEAVSRSSSRGRHTWGERSLTGRSKQTEHKKSLTSVYQRYSGHDV